jgi:SP family general alpha glucoside:H+ symporter-like MFS transporter
MPKFLGVNELNLGALTGFIWAGACFLLLTWCYFRLPEPKDRTYGGLDVLFEHKVSARRFHKTKVDQFSGENTDIIDTVSSDNSITDEKVGTQYRV